MKPAIVNLSLLLATVVAAADAGGAEPSLANLWQERIHSVVAIEYTVESELSSRTVTSFGVAVDNHGTVVLPWDAVDPSVPVSQLQHFKAYLPGKVEGHDATYLGSSDVFRFQYVRTDAKTAAELVPITRWGVQTRMHAKMMNESGPLFLQEQLGQPVWGIGLRSKEEGFAPYLLRSCISLTQAAPELMCVTQEATAGPGLPVFDSAGGWVGLAANSYGQTYLEYSPHRRDGEPVMLVNLEESSAYFWSPALYDAFQTLPQDSSGRPITWAGAMALSPQPDGTLRVEQVGEGPGRDAGLRPGDVIVAVDGGYFSALYPLSLELEAFQNKILRERPGDRLKLTVRRVGSELSLAIPLTDMPKLAREAQRRLFAGPAVVIREPVASDGYGDGAIVAEVRPDGRAAAAGLRAGDRIVAIDSSPAGPFFETAGRLGTVDAEVALAVRRPGEETPVTLHVHWTR